MDWLAKISLKTMFNRMGAFSAVILLLSLVVISAFCGYRLGNYYHNYQDELINNQQSRLTNLYEQQARSSSQINTLAVELEVERMANQRSVALLKEMEVEHYQVKKQLAFYEKVMAPEKQADGLAIDSVFVFPTKSPHHYRFDVTLVQQQIKKRFAKGYVAINVIGSLNNKPHTLKVSDISSLTRKEMSFSFKYFQVIEGDFTLPSGFVPEKIEIIATLPQNKWQKFNRTNTRYPWRSIIKHPS